MRLIDGKGAVMPRIAGRKGAGSSGARPRKGARIVGDARDALAADMGRRYAAGVSIRALAAESGRSYGFVHRVLAEQGVTFRARGGATRGRAAR